VIKARLARRHPALTRRRNNAVELHVAPLLKIVAAAIAAACALLGAPAYGAEGAGPDETARYLAGMAPRAGSALEPLTLESGWKKHAAYLDRTWADLEDRQLSKIRAWSRANVTVRRAVTYYFFSGPDFLYVDAFFPNSSTYVLAGLEPIGALPDIRKLRPGSRDRELAGLRTSLRSLLRMSYFITREMDTDLRAGQLRGTLPILYVFLARAGKTIREVSFVSLAADGTLEPESGGRSGTHGVKIVFSGSDGKAHTLYYFRTDLSNRGLRSSGFLAFCARLGIGDIFIKAASYLLHGRAFSQVREFLLERGATVVQDDTGIPLRYFDRGRWHLRPFGEYVGPIPMFRGHYQPHLEDLFDDEDAPPIAFGVGYRWRPNQSHVLLAVNKGARPSIAPPAEWTMPAAAPAGQAGAARPADIETGSYVVARQDPIGGALWLVLQGLLIVSLVWLVLFWFGNRRSPVPQA
jgi:hypothetical protein